jgi:hypothetical protein
VGPRRRWPNPPRGDYGGWLREQRNRVGATKLAHNKCRGGLISFAFFRSVVKFVLYKTNCLIHLHNL